MAAAWICSNSFTRSSSCGLMAHDRYGMIQRKKVLTFFPPTSHFQDKAAASHFDLRSGT